MTEEWRTIPSFPAYEASSLGRVRRQKTGRVLRAWIRDPRKGDYLAIELQRDGKRRQPYVHTLVCEAFHGRCPMGLDQVNHLNLIKSDNRPSNIEWSAARANVHHYHASTRPGWTAPRTRADVERRTPRCGTWGV